MIVRVVIVVMLCVAFASQVRADTRTGTANLATIQNWAFTPVGAGQVTITLSWTTKKADLAMVLVCGIAEPVVFGITGGGLDQMGVINAGVESDVPCEVGVTSNKNRSKYRIHFQHAISQPSEGSGRTPLALSVTAGRVGTMLAAAVASHIGQLRQLLAYTNGTR